MARAQQRRNPPFRAEHVGSLLRPRALKDAARGLREGTVSEADYRARLDADIARVVRMQEDIGLKSITDGEFGKSSWFGFFFERLEGFTIRESLFKFYDAEGHDHEFNTCYVNAPMRRPAPIAVDEFLRLAALTRETPKANLPTPSAVHFFRGDDCRDPRVYPDIEAWWQALVEIYRAEVEALAAAGCTYLQLDEVPLAMLCDAAVRERAAALGLDPSALVERYLDVVNQVLAVRPAQMTVGMHLCRGNLRSMWLASGGYEAIAERLFNQLDVDAYFLEYDTPRAGDFAPLRYVPAHKTAVLGLISSKTPTLEPLDALRRRIDEAARYLPLEQLAVSPQCGFASGAGGNPLSEAEQEAKLRLVVELARQVWG
jgi:5-methyltetrahydropteroyltriglutamate--homocysteine methyltransferase